ncbi:hypothetical protein BC941DRAFT_181017 [Chlamydoabsidia padenii]|nr:hypothetical protein BC941DRAFT_181017 [Chlamydoabsidia padenii]
MSWTETRWKGVAFIASPYWFEGHVFYCMLPRENMVRNTAYANNRNSTGGLAISFWCYIIQGTNPSGLVQLHLTPKTLLIPTMTHYKIMIITKTSPILCRSASLTTMCMLCQNQVKPPNTAHFLKLRYRCSLYTSYLSLFTTSPLITQLYLHLYYYRIIFFTSPLPPYPF